jgi:hypothetical protein
MHSGEQRGRHLGVVRQRRRHRNTAGRDRRHAFADQPAGMHQHARRCAFIQPVALQPPRAHAERHQPGGRLHVEAGFMRHDGHLDLGGGVAEGQRAEALPCRRLQLLVAARVVRSHEQEVGMGLDDLVSLVQRQHAPRVGQRVHHHRGVGARLDQFVEIADGTVARRHGQWSVLPARAVGIEQPAPGEVGGAGVVVARHRDQRALQAPRHVLDETRLAAAGRAFQQHRQALRIGGLEQRALVGGRVVIGFGRQRVGVRVGVHERAHHRAHQPCCGVAALGMPSIGASSVPTVLRVNDSTRLRVPSGSLIHCE